MTDATTDTYTVVSSNDRDRRVFFEGTKDDARAYLVANYPRPHIEPGQAVSNIVPDAFVVAPDGSKSAFDGKVWDDETDTFAPEPVDTPAPVETDPTEYTAPNGEVFRYDDATDSMVKVTDESDTGSRPTPGDGTQTGGV